MGEELSHDDIKANPKLLTEKADLIFRQILNPLAGVEYLETQLPYLTGESFDSDSHSTKSLGTMRSKAEKDVVKWIINIVSTYIDSAEVLFSYENDDIEPPVIFFRPYAVVKVDGFDWISGLWNDGLNLYFQSMDSQEFWRVDIAVRALNPFADVPEYNCEASLIQKRNLK